jgi:hypothetical protein
LSFFEKRRRDLKFLYIITSSASALPIFRGLPLCFEYFLLYLLKREHYAANRAERVFFAKDGANLGEHLFAKTGMADFRGCFEYAPRPKFNLCPKMRGFCFHPFSPFFHPLFGGSFVFYKIRRFFEWTGIGGDGFKYFAQYIFQTGLKNRCILVKVVFHELWLIYK